MSAAPAGVEWNRWSTEMHLLVTDASALAAAQPIVETQLDAVEIAASRFRRDSEVSALAGAGGQRTPVSPVLADLITAALEAARATDGDVDPTVGTAMVALGYGALGYGRDAGNGPLLTALRVPVRWTDVEFDGRSVRVPDGTLLDLGATAKAAAADWCARRVYTETGSGVLVNLGGDIATAGPTPEGGWRILVQDTDADPACQVVIGGDTGLATSSTRRRRWRHRDEIVHHIIDPRTGSSAEPVWRSVSVAASTCLAANALSTAAIIRGRRAPGWLAGLGIPARFVDQSGLEQTVGGWPS